MDPIANMLTSIRNASLSKRPNIRIPYSTAKARIAEVLRKEGYVGPTAVVEEGPQKVLEINLSYDNGMPAIRGIERVSKPSRRWYVRKDEIPRVVSGMGIAVISSSKGVITDREARKLGVGGELICKVW